MPEIGDQYTKDIRPLIDLADILSEIRPGGNGKEDLKTGLKEFLADNIIKDLKKFNNIIYCSLPFWWHQEDHDGSWFKHYMPVKVFNPDKFNSYAMLYYLLDKKWLSFSFSDFACRNLKEPPHLIQISFDEKQKSIEATRKKNILSIKAPLKSPVNKNPAFEKFKKLFDGTAPGPEKDHYHVIRDKINKINENTLQDSVKKYIRSLGKEEQKSKSFLEPEWFRTDKTSKEELTELRESFKDFIRLHPVLFGQEVRHIIYAPSKVFYFAEHQDSDEAYQQSYGGLIAVIEAPPKKTKPEDPKDKDLEPVELKKEDINPVFDFIRLKTSIKFREWAAWDWSEKNKRDLINHSTKSAIAAIMSRNGSHNIGSHVIAAVGNNVNDVPDDQQLFKYIQQRLDFIATVTTEFPNWSQPMWFVKDVMRRFYMQRHLLNYIASADGLRAYEPQGDDDAENQNSGRLVVKVRVKVKKDKDNEFVEAVNPTDKAQEGKIAGDAQVAIPGGIIGQHAFYTILENIIRNSAKHGCKVSNGSANCEITIDLEDDKKKDYVVITIWDNVSNVKGKYGEKKKLPDFLNSLLKQSFINRDSGELIKENWGLAEMKIAAGFLSGAAQSDISADGDKLLFDDNSKREGIIRAVAYKPAGNGGAEERLGFQFAINKPKELLLVLAPGDSWNLNMDAEELKKYAVYLERSLPTVNTDCEMIVLDEQVVEGYTLGKQNENHNFCEKLEQLLRQYPARVIIIQNEKSKNTLTPELKVRVTTITEKEFKSKCGKVFKENINNIENSLFNLKVWLQYVWVGHLLNRREIGAKAKTKFQVLIKLTGDTGGTKTVNAELVFKKIKKTNLEIPDVDNEDSESLFKTTWNDIVRAAEGKKKNLEQLNYKGLADCWIDAANSSYPDMEKVVENKLQNYVNTFWQALTSIGEKYSEDVETLPLGYKACGNSEAGGWAEVKSSPGDLLTVQVFTDSSKLSDNNGDIISFNRHGLLEKGQGRTIEYNEPISGAQYFFSALSNPPDTIEFKMKVIAQLLEATLCRLLIIDERVSDYWSKNFHCLRPEKQPKLNIEVPEQVKYEKQEKRLSRQPVKDGVWYDLYDLTQLDKTGSYDAVIIHQGVLDELFKGNSQGMSTFLEKLKTKIPLVVVTSGRGKPSNLPKNIRYIPFSNIETSLIKSYPEKILLVQALTRVKMEN